MKTTRSHQDADSFQVPALDRALSILELLARHPEGMRMREIAEKLELQLALAEEALRQAMRAYEKFTGVEYEAVTTTRAATATTNEKVLAMQEKYGVKINNPVTKGTGE